MLVPGRLSSFAAGFARELAGLGYTPLSAANQLRVLAHVGRWLHAQHLEAGEFTPERAGLFLRARRTEGYTCWLSERGLAPLLGYLREAGVVPGLVCAPYARALYGPGVSCLLVAAAVSSGQRCSAQTSPS